MPRAHNLLAAFIIIHSLIFATKFSGRKTFDKGREQFKAGAK